MNCIEQQTKTGGREATNGVIPGRFALSVGKPDWVPPKGWSWVKLTDVARLETGHTPSRRHSEYWDGDIPWIGIRDATSNHGREIDDTAQHVTQLGIENSSARILPAKTVCLSRTASVGYVVIMNRPMATSQDFVNWVCSDAIDFRYLASILIAENASFALFSRGTTHQTIYFPEAKAFHVLLPPIAQQKRIVDVLWAIHEKIQLNHQIKQTLEQIAQALFKSWFVDFEPVKAKIAAKARWLAAQQGNESASPVCYADEVAPQSNTLGLETYMNLAAMEAISGAVHGCANAAGGTTPGAAKDQHPIAQMQAEQPEQYAQLKAIAELFPSAMQGSELGEIPEGWEARPLDTLAKYQNGLALQKYRPDGEDEYLPVVKIAQLKKGYADGEEKASVNITEECIIDNGDVVFSWSGSLMVDIWCGGRAALNQHLFKVTSRDYPKWLYFHFTKHHLEDFKRIAASKAVTMGHIKREHLRAALCAIPKEPLVEHATSLLGAFVEKQIELRLESQTLSELRDTLLPKLLSGELALPEAEQKIQEATGV